MLRVGLVMLQGARHAHIAILESASEELGVDLEIIELRTPLDLQSNNLDAIVFPGGESTTMRLTGANDLNSLLPALFEWLRTNVKTPVLATCAGAILLAQPNDRGAPLVNATVNRNGYGSQADSFQAMLEVPTLGEPYPGVFIRAPRFDSIGEGAQAIAIHNQEIVGVRQENRLSVTFHPELSGDLRFHTWLLKLAEGEDT
jgi:5'-phosphate synthase pdxT subunit